MFARERVCIFVCIHLCLCVFLLSSLSSRSRVRGTCGSLAVNERSVSITRLEQRLGKAALPSSRRCICDSNVCLCPMSSALSLHSFHQFLWALKRNANTTPCRLAYVMFETFTMPWLRIVACGNADMRALVAMVALVVILVRGKQINRRRKRKRGSDMR